MVARSGDAVVRVRDATVCLAVFGDERGAVLARAQVWARGDNGAGQTIAQARVVTTGGEGTLTE